MTDDNDLDLLFQAARAAPVVPSAPLMARVLNDAYDLQPEVRVGVPARVGFWSGLGAAISAALGGSGVVAGLGTAAVAGVFIGYASPDTLDWLSGAVFPGAVGEVDLMSADDLFLSEG